MIGPISHIFSWTDVPRMRLQLKFLFGIKALPIHKKTRKPVGGGREVDAIPPPSEGLIYDMYQVLGNTLLDLLVSAAEQCEFMIHTLSKLHQFRVVFSPGGYFQIRRSGGLGPHIKFGGKIWGKVQPSSPNERKNLGSSVTTRRKSWEKVPLLGSHLKFRGQNLGYLSFIFLDAKFGAPTRISEAKFGAKPPDLLIWKYPPGVFSTHSR